MSQLYPFQRSGVTFLTKSPRALLADEPGLGKTIQAIVAAEELGAQQILVICPAVVKLNWQKEMQTWLKKPLRTQVMMSRKDRVLKNTQVLILNYDLLISQSIFAQLTRLDFTVGIFDESHYLKSRTAQRTKAVLLRGAVASRCKYKWFLTGTPILNRPVELYPLLKAAAPEVIEPYTSFEKFAYKFCAGYFDGFQLIAKGASNSDELCARLVKSGFMLRRMKKDHLKELPEKQYQLVSIPAPSAKIEQLVKKEFTFSKGDAKYGGIDAQGAEIARLRHELALSKVATCIEHIKGVLDETEKIVVFAYHTAVIAALKEGLKEFNPVVITGSTPATDRHTAVTRFQNVPAHRVFIGQIQAAGVGITLTAASTVVFVESSWVPGEIDQAIDRCHRIGQRNSVRVQFLVLENSVEEHMLRTIIDKKQTIARIIDQEADAAEMFT